MSAVDVGRAHLRVARPSDDLDAVVDDLLVFYLPDADAHAQAIARLRRAGHAPVKSFNPYWDVRGTTSEDPDGYRLVLQHAAWPE